MPPTIQIIHLHSNAPAKPAWGERCNGCGVCCAAEPCPAGQLLFRKRRGSCPALQWRDDERRYACGLLLAPGTYLRWVPKRAEPLVQRWVVRLIAAGKGCDSDAEID